MKLTRLSFNETMERFSDVHDIKTCLKAILIQNHFVNCMSVFSSKIQGLSSKLLFIWRLGADRLWINPGVRPYLFNPSGATVELGENCWCDSLVPIVVRPSAAKVLTAKIGSSWAIRNDFKLLCQSSAKKWKDKSRYYIIHQRNLERSEYVYHFRCVHSISVDGVVSNEIMCSSSLMMHKVHSLRIFSHFNDIAKKRIVCMPGFCHDVNSWCVMHWPIHMANVHFAIRPVIP